MLQFVMKEMFFHNRNWHYFLINNRKLKKKKKLTAPNKTTLFSGLLYLRSQVNTAVNTIF